MRIFFTSALGLALASGVVAQTIDVTANIATSTTWTANNTYNLTTQIYVLPGATLTIEAGTVIASASTANGSGALAVTRGAQIQALGTATNPIIFTSSNDVTTWAPLASHPTGKNPKTGSWRLAANEWGNLTIMGSAYISENALATNTATCNANNEALMEGLVPAFTGDPNVRYGGGDDNDDSGTLRFVSFRYGGRVVGLTNELNGLSLGGIGRGTDISHVEIMNNVDDGIEIWGGTVSPKFVSIWNIGDDSFDIDQGWRGQAQFVLIVQGRSLAGSQGSGVGDNAFEHDGAEDSDYQPVTTAKIVNATVIGQPIIGDGLTAWRDGARVQYRQSIFMDGGETLIRPDGDDGDGANGYGHNGTLTFAQVFTTPDTATSTVNPCPNPAAIYTAQNSGNLAEIRDSIFYRNFNAAAYAESDARGQTNSGAATQPNDNVLIAGIVGAPDPDSPIVSITRAAPDASSVLQVLGLDPRPANAALTSAGFESGDDFFFAGKFRGAFAPGIDWTSGWTASQAFGFTPAEDGWQAELDKGNEGTNGVPILSGSGRANGVDILEFDLVNARPNASSVLFIGGLELNADLSIIPGLAGCLYPLSFVDVGFVTNGNGEFGFAAGALPLPPGVSFYFQSVTLDPLAPPVGLAFSNGLRVTGL